MRFNSREPRKKQIELLVKNSRKGKKNSYKERFSRESDYGKNKLREFRDKPSKRKKR